MAGPSDDGESLLELQPGDFTLESGLMVFTRAYHLKRGFCCGSGCRHCPWKGEEWERGRARRGLPTSERGRGSGERVR